MLILGKQSLSYDFLNLAFLFHPETCLTLYLDGRRIFYWNNLKGPAKQILNSNLKEERFVVEAPWMMYKKVNMQKTTYKNITSNIEYQGYYYLFYSSGWYFEAKYHMRVAKAKHPTGPFVKRNYPVLETDWRLYGAVFQSPVQTGGGVDLAL